MGAKILDEEISERITRETPASIAHESLVRRDLWELVVFLTVYYGMHEILTRGHFFVLIVSVCTYADTKSRNHMLFWWSIAEHQT